MRGLKQDILLYLYHPQLVASFTDAWIETSFVMIIANPLEVASFTDAWIETPVRERISSAERVASFTDAWIETEGVIKRKSVQSVASFTDAWIETLNHLIWQKALMSHLLQMRGLKQSTYYQLPSISGRIFYRCVD